MAPETFADVANWILVCLGAAMAGGTGMALLSYRRNGVFPGQPVDDDGAPQREPALRTVYVKIVIGVIVALWGVAGLTAGTVIGV